MTDNFNSSNSSKSLKCRNITDNFNSIDNCSSFMQYSRGDSQGIVSFYILLATFLIALAGFSGNLVSIYILQNRRIVSNFNRLLIILSYFDAAYIFLFLIEELPPLIEAFKGRSEAMSSIHSYL